MTAYALTHLTIVWSDTIVIYKCQTISVAHNVIHPISRPTGTTGASQWSRRPTNQARPIALFMSTQEQQCPSKARSLPRGTRVIQHGRVQSARTGKYGPPSQKHGAKFATASTVKDRSTPELPVQPGGENNSPGLSPDMHHKQP